MSDPSLHQLERDVEAARAKLAGDLSTLRSPATYSEFSSQLKDEALDMKDALETIEKACDGAKGTALLGIGSVAKRGLKVRDE